MKPILICISFMCLLQSCNSQSKDNNKVDLEKISFTEKYTDILSNVKRLGDQAEPATTLPISYTNETANYQFANIAIPVSSQDEISRNSVGVFLNNTEERATKGIRVQWQIDAIIARQLLDYLTKTYGKPKVLSPIPKAEKSGLPLGYSAYYWDKTNAIFLIQNYSIQNKKSCVSSDLYIVDKKVMINPLNGVETVVDHLKRTYINNIPQ